MNEIDLTTKQKLFLAGCLLGDGHLAKRQSGKYRFSVAHTEEKVEYVRWKYEILKPLCTPKGVYKELKYDKKSGKTYTSYRFYTSTLSCFEKFHCNFYQLQNGRLRKTITQETIDFLPVDPFVLAVFFMDDGTVRSDAYSGRLATQGFTYEEQELLCQYLQKFNIEATITDHSKDKDQSGMNILAAQFPKFVKLIEPVVRQVPCMIYKLNEERKKRPF